MNYPINVKTLSDENLIKQLAELNKFPLDPYLESVIELHHNEVTERLERLDMPGLVEFARIVNKYFPGQNLPIRKKITYSPTQQPAPGFLAIFSRKNRRMNPDSQ